jgi:flagellin-specific chaperone FliS
MVCKCKAIHQAKTQYNKFLERHNKALDYFDNKQISNDTKEKFISEYISIIEQLGAILDVIEEYSNIEAFEGFKI